MSGSADQFDVAIVGARCAGSPLAALLARRGLRVCLLDRAAFPSDTLSTHVVQPSGVQALERIGALEEIMAAGAVPLTRFTYVDGETRLDPDIEVEAFGAPSLCLRRLTLDHQLVAAAARAGAEVRTETAVTGLLREHGRVVGVETKVRAGPGRADGRGRWAQLDRGGVRRRLQVPRGAGAAVLRLGLLRGSGRRRRPAAARPPGRPRLHRLPDRLRPLHGGGLPLPERQGRLPRRPRAGPDGGPRHLARAR